MESVCAAMYPGFESLPLRHKSQKKRKEQIVLSSFFMQFMGNNREAIVLAFPHHLQENKLSRRFFVHASGEPGDPAPSFYSGLFSLPPRGNDKRRGRDPGFFCGELDETQKVPESLGAQNPRTRLGFPVSTQNSLILL